MVAICDQLFLILCNIVSGWVSVSKERSFFPGYVLIEAALVGEVPHVIKNVNGVILYDDKYICCFRYDNLHFDDLIKYITYKGFDKYIIDLFINAKIVWESDKYDYLSDSEELGLL